MVTQKYPSTTQVVLSYSDPIQRERRTKQAAASNSPEPLLLSGEWESERPLGETVTDSVSPDTKHDPCRIPHRFGPGFLIRPMVSDLIRSEEGCSIETDPDAGKDSGPEEKGAIEDEMAGWHQQLNGHEFELTLGWTGNLGVPHSLGSQRARHN